MKKFLREFREFAEKGNMLDLAVGLIIGSAFTGLVNSLVGDIINPFLGLLTGKVDFSNLFIALDGEMYKSVAEAEAAGAAIVKYGSFISNIINFLIMALVVFLLVKGINALRTAGEKKLMLLKKEAEEEAAAAAPTTKICPFCCSEIAIEATRCPHCTSELK